MARLSLSLLGAFQAALDDEPITSFESVKAQALLAYLALEPDRPHSRVTLAGLLWPDRPDAAARNNLRHALSRLRRAIGDRGPKASEGQPFLLVTRETAQFNCASDCWVDVHAFQSLLADGVQQSSVASLADAVALYRGDLLEGFYVSESPEFEDWILLMRERLQRQTATALRHLVAETTQLGDYDTARRYAWRWVELEPWQEAAHRHLMRVLALSGRCTEALARFEACRQTLQDEFSVEPSPATIHVFKQIRDGTVVPELPTTPTGIAAMPPVTQTPEVAISAATGVAGETAPRFVARERELAQLQQHLRGMLGGGGHVVFVTGQAGHGKTALIQAFTRRAQAAHPELAVLGGSCNAYTGVGDPYLPFREILAQAISGGMDAGTGIWGDPRRLSGLLPAAIRALLDHGRDL
ncbi:MAG: BTAD domain-containing putative transcriptional regulator, partial [Anaerolineae bacterium]